MKKGGISPLAGFINFLEGNFKGAIEVYKALLERKPNNINIARNLVILLMLDQRYDEALMVIDRYLSIMRTEKKERMKPRLQDLYRDLVLLKIIVQFKLKKFDKIYSLIKDYLGENIYICPIELEETLNFDLDIENVVTKMDEDDWLKIQRWLQRSKKDELIAPVPKPLKKYFISYLEMVMERENDERKKSDILSLIAILVTSMGKVKKGLNLAQQALEINPNGFVANILFGKINYILGYLNTAYEHFLKAYKVANKNEKYLPLLNIGIVLSQVGLYKDALKYVNKAIKANLSSRIAWYIRAKILLDSERWREAEKAFKALIQMDPRNPKVWIGLGKVYINNGNLTKAIEAFLSAKKLIGDNEELNFLINLARNLK
ncbi:MAG: tetratricopeptide repeat protein [Candidatus Njordarchaeia archaeon]